MAASKIHPSKSAFMLPHRSQTARNVGVNALQKVTVGTAGLAVTAVLARNFPLELLGVWALVSGVVNIVTFADFGLPSALPRLLPAMRADSTRGDPRAVVAIALIVATTMALVVFGIAFPVGLSLPTMYNISSDLHHNSSLLFILSFFIGGILLPLRFSTGVLAASHRYDLIGYAEMASAITKIAGVFMLSFWINQSFVVVAVYMLACSLIAPLLQCTYAIRLAKPRLPTWSEFRILTLPMISLAAASLAVSLATALTLHGPAMIASAIEGGANAAALIGLPIMLSAGLMAIARSSAGFLTPIASGLAAQMDFDKVYQAYRVSTHTLTLVMGGMAAVISLVGVPVLNLWLDGHNLLGDSVSTMATVLTLFTFTAAITAPGLTARVVLSASNAHWRAGITELLGSFIAIFAAVALYALDFGIIGIAMGISGIVILRGCVVMPLILSKHLGISFSRLLIEGWVGPALIAIVFTSLAWWIGGLIAGWSKIGLFLSMLFFAIIWAIACIVTMRTVGNQVKGLLHRIGQPSWLR
ncbi:hypothetical protein ABWH92_01250 [Ahrensia marina]|uniref:lipopolysaccharide biosynthesis protein n=1 Tax=Ahrensia marina TaxID=1514904 RepID=UPI0035CF1DD0